LQNRAERAEDYAVDMVTIAANDFDEAEQGGRATSRSSIVAPTDEARLTSVCDAPVGGPPARRQDAWR